MLDPEYRKKLKLPAEFVCFAHTKGKLYRDKSGTFLTDVLVGNGNDVVYGALYSLYDDYFHIRTLDSMRNCSLSSMGRNSVYDRQHRVRKVITLIKFDTLDEFSRLRYREIEDFEVEMYVGNTNHPEIKHRIERTQKFNFRIKDGLLPEQFKQQYREVKG